MTRIDQALAVPILLALTSGCRMQPEGERDWDSTGILEVRIRGISSEVAAVEVSAGSQTERVMLSVPTTSLDLTLRGLPSGRTTVETRGMRGVEMLQVMQIDAVVREGLRSILSVDLESGSVDRDGGTAPGPIDAGDASGGQAVESDPIVVTFVGNMDFSFPVPGVLEGRTDGDPHGRYRAFLQRAARLLVEPASAVIGVSSLQMRLRQEEDDITLDDLYTALGVRLEGRLTGTSTLADYPDVQDTSGWISLNPEMNLPSAQADLVTGDFEVSIQGRSPLRVPSFDAWIDLRMVYHARSR